jgi:ankyrin repeat protein
MSLLDLPNELLLSIADAFGCASGINALVCTNRRLYFLLNTYLYESYVRTSNHSALPWAAHHGLINTVLKFLDLGANLQATLDSSKRATALHLASRQGHLLIVEALIQSGAHVNAQAYKGITPLHGAVVGGHEHVVRVLLENGADFMKTLSTQSRPTILHVASRFGFYDIVQLLLDKGMGIQVKDGNLQTPLHYAVKFDEKTETWHGNITTVSLLLEKKAVKDSWDRSGQRPKDLARRNPNSIIELLLQDTTNTTLNDAILLDQAIQQRQRRKKEAEERRIRKIHELAAERAAKLMAREADRKAKELLRKTEDSIVDQRLAEKKRLDDILRYEKHSSLRENWAKARIVADSNQLQMEETRKQQSRTSGPKPASTTTQEKQDAAREHWGKLKTGVEERRQNPDETNSRSCSHVLGLLKWKGKGQCNICETEFVKHLFRCVDCGFVACRIYKTYKPNIFTH